MRRQNPKIAIQGITTSFHEAAAMAYFAEPIRTVECLTFHDLCDALERGDADFAVMAIENSIAGSILQNYALLEQHHFSISGEIYLPIHLHLLALPGVRLDEIECVESHPMAIRQCAEYLHAMNGVAVRESDDTALSAKTIADKRLRTTAAIANERAAKKFGLNILARRIETNTRNFTRFLVLSRENRHVSGSNKASLCFEVPDHVGSLADALMTFKAHRINLSRIQSIPILGRPDEYSIHVDVEWKRRKSYDEAIDRVRDQVLTLKVFGEYKKAAMRFQP